MTNVVEMSGVSRLRAANKAQIAEFFDVSIKCVDGWVRRGCPVVKRGNRSTPWQMDALAVAEWYFGRQSEDGDVDPDSLNPQDRRAWYDSEIKRRALQTTDRELILSAEVEEVIATSFAAIAQGLRSLPDTIERRTGCDPDVVAAIEDVLAAEMDALADKLSMLGPVDDDSA